jgi:hypothetical protein
VEFDLESNGVCVSNGVLRPDPAVFVNVACSKLGELTAVVLSPERAAVELKKPLLANILEEDAELKDANLGLTTPPAPAPAPTPEVAVGMAMGMGMDIGEIVLGSGWLKGANCGS